MGFLSFAKTAAGLAALAAVLAACVVVEERPLPPRDEPRFCTREYAPVCAVSRGERRTFGNECMAEVEGWRVVHRGECRRAEERPVQACPMIYRPVCAERRGDRRTFENDCMAQADGYRVVYQGECRGDSRPTNWRPRG